jgi:uncharacterized protein YndB with AHSA1/START domain
MPEAIHQEIVVDASPERVYGALTDSAQFGAMTGGAPADISPEAGGSFTCFGGHIAGRNVELPPGARIVQAWRALGWDPGHYSIARFELAPQGSGTRVVLDHTGFPDGQQEHLAQGWHANFWEPLQKYLG